MNWIGRTQSATFVLGVAVVGLALAACGGGGGGDDDGGLGVINIDQSTKTALVGEQIIEVKDNQFVPAEVTIKPNTKVIWKWTGTSNAHSIQLSGNTSPEQTSGTYERVFDQSGSSFAYQCGVHKAAMTGRIVIE